jgi:hypothetical protein
MTTLTMWTGTVAKTYSGNAQVQKTPQQQHYITTQLWPHITYYLAAGLHTASVFMA